MLEAIRNRLSGWVAILILGTIALALVISFGNMDSGINPETIIAEVNGEKVSVQEFRQGLDSQVQRYQEATGQDVPPLLKEQLGKNVLEGIINSRLLLQYVSDSGYRVSDAAVAAEIRSIPVFQVDGEFSQQTYEALLLSQGLSPAMFEADRRRALETQQLQTTIINSAFVTPADYRRFLELEAETRDISYISFDAATYEADVELAETAISEYYEANSSQFETDETVDVEFVQLKLADIEAETDVDDEMLQTYYEDNIDRFRSETERKSSHILISIEEQSDTDALDTANDLLSRINAGEDFAILAKEFSADPGSAAAGGDLGWSSSGVFVPEFEAALFELQQGEVSAPVKTQFGYHLIKLVDIREGAEQPLDAVREELLADLTRDEAENRFYEQSERLDDLALESLDGLGPVAEDMELELVVINDVSRAGGVVGLPVSEPLISALFSLEVLEDGENTPLIEIEPGHVVVARVTAHDLPTVRPLAEVSDSIKSFLLRQQAAAIAAEKAAAALVELEGGAAISSVAEVAGVDLQSQQAVARGSRDIPGELLQAVFAAPKPGSSPAPQQVLLPDGSVIVAQVDAVTPGKPEELPRNDRDARKVQLEQMVGQSQVAALVQNLRDTATVRIFDDVSQESEAL